MKIYKFFDLQYHNPINIMFSFINHYANTIRQKDINNDVYFYLNDYENNIKKLINLCSKKVINLNKMTKAQTEMYGNDRNILQYNLNSNPIINFKDFLNKHKISFKFDEINIDDNTIKNKRVDIKNGYYLSVIIFYEISHGQFFSYMAPIKVVNNIIFIYYAKDFVWLEYSLYNDIVYENEKRYIHKIRHVSKLSLL